MKKVQVGILGSGNIGTDLLMKIQRSETLNCDMFSGRSLISPGMKLAQNLGVNVSDRGVEAFTDGRNSCSIIVDATSAGAHKSHYQKLKKLGVFIINMTPANIGKLSVPSLDVSTFAYCDTVNMVTCGGQAAIPLASAIANSFFDLPEYIETISTISSLSAGPGTRNSLDEYISTTERGMKLFTKVKRVKALININPAHPPITMQTTVMVKCENPEMKLVHQNVNDCIEKIKSYVPGYHLTLPPVYDKNRMCLVVGVRVEGLGDYLPKYAGNLDIITCAALRVAENFAETID
jgi:acetaldehyde dehydrogenase (acetylating)